jgi:precorrin-6y C5,15-methyltransferase (decarboxylating) CbiE subunit
VAVLVSGDPGLFSLARHVLAQFGREQCVVVPGISSVQVALGRLGLDWADARLVSAHGRPPDVEPEQLASADKVAILAGGRRGREWSARAAAALQASHVAYLCENLTLKDERVRPVAPHEIQQAASLSIILLVRRSLVP